MEWYRKVNPVSEDQLRERFTRTKSLDIIRRIT